MTVEANSRPPIHQRNDGIGFRAVAIGVGQCNDYEPNAACDSSVSVLFSAGLRSEAESLSR